MPTVTFIKQHNLPKLMDEMLASVPAFRPEPEQEAIIKLSGIDNIIVLTYPDDLDIDEAVLQQLIDNHDVSPTERQLSRDEKLSRAIAKSLSDIDASSVPVGTKNLLKGFLQNIAASLAGE